MQLLVEGFEVSQLDVGVHAVRRGVTQLLKLTLPRGCGQSSHFGFSRHPVCTECCALIWVSPGFLTHVSIPSYESYRNQKFNEQFRYNFMNDRSTWWDICADKMYYARSSGENALKRKYCYNIVTLYSVVLPL